LPKLVGVEVAEVLVEVVDEVVDKVGEVVVGTVDTLLAVEAVLEVVETMVVEGVVCAPTEKSPL